MRGSVVFMPLMAVALYCSCMQSAGAAQVRPEAPSTSGTCQSILVPSYFPARPSGSDWDRAIADSPWNPKTRRTMILNPNSGPGKAKNRDFAAMLRKVATAGGTTIAYVHTSYGKLPLPAVEVDVDRYLAWYAPDGLSGIFVDEVATDPKLVPTYYQPLLTYITKRLPKGAVTFNPGTYPDAAYAAMKTASSTSSFNLVTFEDSLAAYGKQEHSVPAWARQYPAARFVEIVYNVPAARVAGTLLRSAQRNVGTVYITDEVYPNPYQGLPSYWKQLVSFTQAGCTSAQ